MTHGVSEKSQLYNKKRITTTNEAFCYKYRNDIETMHSSYTNLNQLIFDVKWHLFGYF